MMKVFKYLFSPFWLLPIHLHALQPSSLYKGESVVLTGSTGFVGLRTLKTLLTHTEVENVILPIRVNGDSSEKEAIKRFTDVLAKYGEGLDLSINNPALCFVPVSSGKYLDSISRAPKSVLGKCSTILHVAATTGWEVPQEELISTDMEPTLEFLDGASDVLPNLKSFVFTSSGYAEGKNKVSDDMPVPEGPLSEVLDCNDYFSDYAKVKVMTEHAIESWVNNQFDCHDNTGSNYMGTRVAIVRPGAVAPSIGLDGVPVGWHTGNMGLAAAMKLSHPSSKFGKLLKTIYFRKGVDTGIIPVDHVANMIVLTGGNRSMKGEDGKPFYVNACSPTNLEAKWKTMFERGFQVPLDISDYENDLEAMLVRAETKLGYGKAQMRLLRTIAGACGIFTKMTFHDWKFETKNQGLLYDGLHPEYRKTMPVSVSNRKQMENWVDEIMFKIGGRMPATNSTMAMV